MRWTTICFDLDNTLFSHEEAFEKAINYCLRSTIGKKAIDKYIDYSQMFLTFKKYSDQFWADYEHSIITPREYRRKRFLETMKEYGLLFSEKDADEFHELYYNIVDDFSEPFPFLHELMKKITCSGVKIGIITNGTVDTQYNKIEKLELMQWLGNECIFISEELKIWKPDPTIFHTAKARLHSDGGFLFVGDSWNHDVVGAIEAGWDSIFLNTRNEEPQTAHKPFAICFSLEEVAEIIFRENQMEG